MQNSLSEFENHHFQNMSEEQTQVSPLEILLCDNKVFAKIENNWEYLPIKKAYTLPQEFQDVIFKGINNLEELKTNRSPNILKHYSTHRIARIQVLEDAILLYKAHKSLPWKINKHTGFIENQAAYSEIDLPFLTQLHGTRDTYIPTSIQNQRRVRTCANTKLSSLKK